MVDEDLEFIEEIDVPLRAVLILDQNVLARKNTSLSAFSACNGLVLFNSTFAHSFTPS